MTFKNNWEKTDEIIVLPCELITQMILAAFPNERLIEQKVISGGCANLNFKIILDNHSPLLLRVYLRDPDACFREQKIAALLNNKIPVPQTYFIGKIEKYQFAVTEFINGITLRELLLRNQPQSMEALMLSVGEMLYRIQQHTFSQEGIFDKDLNILPHHENLLEFASNALKHPTVGNQLTAAMLSKINNIFQKHGFMLAQGKDKNLVHADFDPVNILVDKIDGEWKITGIIDWEFTFSGSTLCDIANMLRYAHEMPPVFESAFLNGLTKSGFILPNDWRISIDLLNLLSLLDCLARANPSLQPNQCHDITKLISNILLRLDTLP